MAPHTGSETAWPSTHVSCPCARILVLTAVEMSPERGARIGVAAMNQFARSGYAKTTLGDIARRVGLTEAQVQDEIVTKEALVAELTRPLLERLDALVRTASDADSHDADEVAEIMGAYLGVLVEYRQLVEVLLGDPTAAACPAVTRLRIGLDELRNELAGPAGGFEGRILASAALGAVHRAVADLTDVELLAMRTAIIEAAAAILVAGYHS